MSEPRRCPSCDADFDGGPIPENIRQYYSPPYRWSRRIAIYCRDRDRTVAYRCPDCAHEWPTEQRLSADAMLAARKAQRTILTHGKEKVPRQHAGPRRMEPSSIAHMRTIAMTDPTAWPNPDRPGVPLNPERDGWHWVSRPMHGVLPMQWLEIAGGGWAGDMICILASEAARMNWRYLGLCLTPAEVAAAVQAEREACAAAVESRAAAIDHKECCGFPAPSYGPPECCCEPVLMISDRDAAGAIRARGPADALAEAQKAAYCEGWNDRESDFLAGVDRTGMVVVSADALAQARREGMEAAARIVESVSEWQGQDYYCDSCKGGAIYPDREDVAAKIRSAAGEGGK